MRDIEKSLSEILATPLERITKPALTWAIQKALQTIQDLRSDNAKLRALCEIPPGIRVP